MARPHLLPFATAEKASTSWTGAHTRAHAGVALAAWRVEMVAFPQGVAVDLAHHLVHMAARLGGRVAAAAARVGRGLFQRGRPSCRSHHPRAISAGGGKPSTHTPLAQAGLSPI